MKILVTGANGQLGSEIRKLSLKNKYYKWIFSGSKELDLSDLVNLENELSKINPAIIINCAGHTDVDKAESEPELSDLLNHQSVALISKWSHINNCKLVHISTDYVFAGNSFEALSEEAQAKPVNTYGITKLAGERACLQNNPNAIIIRTSWVFSSFGNNFVKTMVRLMQERDILNVVNDQIGSPTYAGDIAEIIMVILNHEKWKPGLYNFSNEGKTSWYQFAIAIQEISGFDCEICAVSSKSYPAPAKRPAFSLLDKSKIKREYGIEATHYKVGLIKCLELLKSNKKVFKINKAIKK